MTKKAAEENHKIGLALSGGGFRATLYAVGSLIRLNETGLLKDIDTITSVSGGAIAAGYLAKIWDQLKFNPETGSAEEFEAHYAVPLLAFCHRTIDLKAGFSGLFSPFHSIGDKLIQQYDKHLFSELKLDQVANDEDAPEFVYYATNYDTGVSAQITKQAFYDHKIGRATGHGISLAQAVAISSSFPPFFAPVTLDGSQWKWTKTNYAELFEQDSLRRRLILCDGGLYDNLGLEKLWKTGSQREFDTVFVCDSGAPLQVPFQYSDSLFGKLKKAINWRNNWLPQFLRMTDIMVNQQRALRKRRLIEIYISGDEYNGAYWGIDTNIEDYPIDDHLLKYEPRYKKMSELPTQLRPFDEQHMIDLLDWSYALTDAALRGRYCSSLHAKAALPGKRLMQAL